ncbi:MAG: sigma-54-dependent Fis family transcriptional regulator [Methylococcus sp.]|nr:MAG: sigma-54-dependent Fis family transcriptional regulator [Methylococcus sp.]
MFDKLVGQSPNFESMLRSARMVAATDVTVLIIGETGTGKEVLAQALQQHSPRANKPFITINCAALPEALVESELFGHKKGSFTGATGTQVGRLQAADGGTVFMDEVDSLPLPLQAKLLRFLETGEIQPVGETNTQNVNVRIIAATNANLQDRIANGEFRRDLYYRLNVVPLDIPPLRERIGDVQVLLQHFINQFTREHGLPKVSISKAALNRLVGYAWPGNVRELRNVCERLCILLAGRTIEENNLPPEIVSRGPTQRPEIELPERGINLEQVEIDLIRQALQRTNGNRSRSAKLLGISRDTLLYRMQKHGLG